MHAEPSKLPKTQRDNIIIWQYIYHIKRETHSRQTNINVKLMQISFFFFWAYISFKNPIHLVHPNLKFNIFK